jgi:hypothetical protein
MMDNTVDDYFDVSNLPFSVHPRAASVGEPAAGVLRLNTNRPNPFDSSTAIPYFLPAASSVRLSIHDAGGRLIRTLVDEDRGAGPHAISWDGKTDSGAEASSGIYCCSVIAIVCLESWSESVARLGCTFRADSDRGLGRPASPDRDLRLGSMILRVHFRALPA